MADRTVPNIVKFCLSCGLLLCALVMWALHPTRYAGFLALGMACSSVGDFCLSAPYVKRRVREPLPLGIAAFMVAHLFYLLGYIARGFSPVAMIVALLSMGAVGTALWATKVRRKRGSDALFLNIGSLVYLWWLCVMFAAATATALAHGGLSWLAAGGAVLFLVSDGIIGVTALGGRRMRDADLWIWATYVPAQALILASQIALW